MEIGGDFMDREGGLVSAAEMRQRGVVVVVKSAAMSRMREKEIAMEISSLQKLMEWELLRDVVKWERFIYLGFL